MNIDWTAIIGIMGVVITNSGLFLWSRSETRQQLESYNTQMQQYNAQMEAYRQEAQNDRRAMQGVVEAIKDEIKDFHGRLCAIEERRLK